MSLEKEVFPFMAQDRELFAFDLEGKCAVNPLLMFVCVWGGGGGFIEKDHNTLLDSWMGINQLAIISIMDNRAQGGGWEKCTPCFS